MSINFRRGFFRLWMALAVLWIAPAVYVNSDGLGLTEPGWLSEPAWTHLSLFRKENPEYDDLSDLEVADRLYFEDFSYMTRAEYYARIGIENARELYRNEQRNDALLIIFALPLALLVLGLGVVWIASGFKRKPF